MRAVFPGAVRFGFFQVRRGGVSRDFVWLVELSDAEDGLAEHKVERGAGASEMGFLDVVDASAVRLRILGLR